MPSDNHNLEDSYVQGDDWDYNDEMATIEERLVVRDLDANKAEYTPHDGALFIATDTGAVYDGEGGAWTLATRQFEELAAQTKLSVGAATEIFESSEGSTVVKNSDGKPINIQLYPSGRAFLVANQSTETTISTQNEWYEIAGTWEDAHMNYLTHDGIGGLTYQGDVTTQIQYLVGGSYISPSNNAQYEIAMFKDDVLKERTVQSFSPPRQDERLPLPPIFGFTDNMTTGMRHSVRIRCTNGTTNITAPALSFVIRG